MAANATADEKRRRLFVWSLGVFICLLGISVLTQGGVAVLGGTLWLLSGLIVLPISRRLIFTVVDGIGGPDISASGTLVVVLAVLSFAAGFALISVSDAAGTPTEPEHQPTEAPVDTPVSDDSTTPTHRSGPTLSAPRIEFPHPSDVWLL